ncbi:hypothetical protein BT69DRAFT_1321786 [Atractiella rhizophila]|nr:hypothetical protein BT69DRAFT_1321786 [Atractiella rhizophila]
MFPVRAFHSASQDSSTPLKEEDSANDNHNISPILFDDDTNSQSWLSQVLDAFLPSVLGTDIIVSSSTEHATEIRGAITAAANIWIFISLLFVGNLVDKVRSEEWFRRLTVASQGDGRSEGTGVPFAHLNHVSSNLGGALRQAVDLFTFFGGSSKAFKSVFLSALLSLGLNEFAPSLLQLVPGWYSVGLHSISIPSLPPLSIHSNLSVPFSRTASLASELSTVYLQAQLLGTPIRAYRNFPDAIVPLPNISFTEHGEEYATDFPLIPYTCSWMAPTTGDPVGNSTQEAFRNRAIYAGGGYLGSGRAPFFPGTADNVTWVPSFDGALMIVVQAAPLNDIQMARNWWIDLSSSPRSSIPLAWAPYQQEWATTNEDSITTDVSMLLCLPQVTIPAYTITALGSTLWRSDDPLAFRVGNIDETQLKIAMSDCLLDFSTHSPFAFLVLPFNPPPPGTGFLLVYTPANESSLGPLFTSLVQGALPAYLDRGPYGKMKVESQGQRLGLALKSQNEFLWAVGVFYILVSIVGGYVLLLQRKEKPHATRLSVSNVLRLVEWKGSGQAHRWGRLNGSSATEYARDVAGGDGMEADGEDIVFCAFSHGMTSIRYLPVSNGVLKTLTIELQPPIMMGLLVRELRRVRKFAAFITPTVGAAFVAFGAYAYRHDVLVPIEVRSTQLVLVSTVSTILVGFWRTLALGGSQSAIRELRSEEWTRFSDRWTRCPRVDREEFMKTADTISNNRTSVLDSARYSLLFKPRFLVSGYYRLAFISFLVVSACSFISQGAIQLHLRPVPIQNFKLSNVSSFSADIPSLYNTLGPNAPWATEQSLIGNGTQNPTGFQAAAKFGEGYAYLEHELGAVVGLKMPQTDGEGYYFLQPQETIFDRNASIRFYTDLGLMKMACEWTAPRLQEWNTAVDISTFLSIEIPDKHVKGLVSPPVGYPWFHPLQRPQRMNEDKGYVFTGLFAWALFGSSSGSKVNLDFVPHSNLSSHWQTWLRNDIIPTYDSSFTSEFAEVPTKLTTLVCEPNIDILYNSSATIYNGMASFHTRKEAAQKVGNLDFSQLAFLVYSLGSSLAGSTLGSFHPFLQFGLLPGSIAISHSLVGVNSSIPRGGKDISKSFNKIITSQLKIFSQSVAGNVSSLSAPVGERYAVGVSMPQLIATGAMFGALSIATLIFQLRTKLRKFTLAGILLAGGTDLEDWKEK